MPRIQARNLVFAGTTVASGTGRAVVFGTGADTEFGRIYRLAGSVRGRAEPAPARGRGRRAARRAASRSRSACCCSACGWPRGAPFVDAFLYALGVMVALVPEGLPAVMSVSLAIGVQRMAAAQALIKRLSSVETLGSTTVICTDKTGTLTAGEMTATRVWCDGRAYDVTGVGYGRRRDASSWPRVAGEPARGAAHCCCAPCIHCNNARLIHDDGAGWSILGDPTEGALLVLAAKAGYDVEAQLRRTPRLREIPFDSQRKRMSVVVQDGAAAAGLREGRGVGDPRAIDAVADGGAAS